MNVFVLVGVPGVSENVFVKVFVDVLARRGVEVKVGVNVCVEVNATVGVRVIVADSVNEGVGEAVTEFDNFKIIGWNSWYSSFALGLAEKE